MFVKLKINMFDLMTMQRKFPSPCGVMVMKPGDYSSNIQKPVPNEVSVPLRGNGHETSKIFKPYLDKLSRWSIDTPHFSVNKYALLTGQPRNGTLVTLAR